MRRLLSRLPVATLMPYGPLLPSASLMTAGSCGCPAVGKLLARTGTMSCVGTRKADVQLGGTPGAEIISV